MKKTFNILTSVALAGIMMLGTSATAFAAKANTASDNMTRQQINVASDHVITFTLPTATGGSATVEFPVEFDLSSATHTGWTKAGQVLTRTSPGVNAAEVVTLTVANVINPGSNTNYQILVGSDVDSGKIMVPIRNKDQIVVTAEVEQTLIFDVKDKSGTDNAVGFGPLSSSALNFATDVGTSSSLTAISGGSSEFLAGTNAASGYFVEVEGDTLTSLQNAAHTLPVMSSATPTLGTPGFGINVTPTTVSGAVIDTKFGSAGLYSMTAAAGTPELVVTNAGPTAQETFGVNYAANISALTPAGDYATALTYTMTANF